jgi:single-strand DNA-binding protein
MNNVVLTGRLTANPELKVTQSGTKVCVFALAVNKDKEHTDFPQIVCFEKTAENLCTYQKKGRMIGVNGRLQTRSYERQDGTKAYVTEVIANTVEYLSSKSDNSAKTQQNEVVEVAEVPVSVSDDDLPF